MSHINKTITMNTSRIRKIKDKGIIKLNFKQHHNITIFYNACYISLSSYKQLTEHLLMS